MQDLPSVIVVGSTQGSPEGEGKPNHRLRVQTTKNVCAGTENHIDIQ